MEVQTGLALDHIVDQLLIGLRFIVQPIGVETSQPAQRDAKEPRNLQEIRQSKYEQYKEWIVFSNLQLCTMVLWLESRLRLAYISLCITPVGYRNMSKGRCKAASKF